MDDNEAICVNCLNTVDPKTHHDCTLTFDNLLAEEEIVGTRNFLLNEETSTAQQPQMNNPRMLEGGTEGKNLLSRKPDSANRENPFQNPPEETSSNRNSTSTRVLEAHNPVAQPSESTGYGNSILSHNEGNRFFYGLDQPYYPTNPLYSHYRFGQTIGQIAVGSKQQEDKFANAMPQNNERNRLHQEYAQSSYGQNLVRNTSPPHTVPDFYTAFPKPVQNNSMNAFGHMDYQPYLNYPLPQNQFTSYEPQATMASPNHNMRVENYPQNIKTSPINPEPKVASKSYNITVNKERDLFAENKLSTPCLDSKSEMQCENRVELDTVHNRFVKNDSQNTQQKNAERSTMQKNEIRSTPRKNVKRGAAQKNVERSVHQQNELKSSSEKHSDKNILQKDAEKSVQEKGIKKGVQAKDAEQDAQTKDAEKGAHAKDPEKGAHAKDPENGASAKDPENGASAKDAEKGAHAKDAEKGTHATDAEKGTHATEAEKPAHATDAAKGAQATDAAKGAHAKDAGKGAHAMDIKNKQENAGRFTGEGYKSIEEFIEALYNGTLYKRY